MENCINEERKKFKVTNAIDLINRIKEEPEPVILWDKIPEGSIGLITGVAKTGKTTFAENLAISLSVGRKEYFGKPLNGKPRKVLFMNLEESYRIRTRRNIKQVSELSESEFKLFCENYISTPGEFPEFIVNDDNWQLMSDYIKKSEAEIVFIDSLTHMFNGKIEDSQSCQKFIQKMQQYIVSQGKTVIVIHHNTKGNDKPIDQDNIAGSRVVIQYFQYAYGFANVPTARGGKYMCMLNNKYFGKDDNEAILYSISENGWISNLGVKNKFDLYKEFKAKVNDGRIDTTNQDLIYDYFVDGVGSTAGTISTTISSLELMDEFVSTNTMAKDTLYQSLRKLMLDDKIVKDRKGVYYLKKKDDGAKK